MAETAPHLCEPFHMPRQTGRLLHDLGVMVSLLRPEKLNDPILDFGAGSCWITETLAKMGQRVTAFDIHSGLAACIDGRVAADARIDPTLISHQSGDGHAMPFADRAFGHLLCFDTLHHMHDFNRVFCEFFRVLKPGGRAIFVEPGARHSTSPETIAFLQQKADDPSWIERDIVIEEIDRCARAAGFASLMIAPMQHPGDLMTFPLASWAEYRKGHAELRQAVAERIAHTNYNERVIFYFDKQEGTP